MTADLTIFTASLPERADMLNECIDSVHAQTVHPARHVISVNFARKPQWLHKNEIAEPYTGWMMFLDDDDLLDPEYIEVCMKVAEELGHPSVVWAYNRGGYVGYNQQFSRQGLEHDSTVAHCAVFSSELFDGFLDQWGFDWRFWQRKADDSRVKFQAVNEVLWTYRYHGSNESMKDTVRH